MKGVRVYLLDDHEFVLRGLRDLLEAEGCVIVGESGSAEEATRRILALAPDISILDARLPDGTGIEVSSRCAGMRARSTRPWSA